MKKFDRKLILSDDSEYRGYGFGSGLEKITEWQKMILKQIFQA